MDLRRVSSLEIIFLLTNHQGKVILVKRKFIRLLRSISGLEIFHTFLEAAVEESHGEFEEVKEMINKIMTLLEIRF